MIRTFLLVVFSATLVLALTRCATQMSPAAEKIRVTTNPDVVHGCEFLGQVKGHSNYNGQTFMADLSENNATAEMQNAAAQMGADTIYLERIKARYWSGTTVSGDAYRCSGQVDANQDVLNCQRNWTARCQEKYGAKEPNKEQ